MCFSSTVRLGVLAALSRLLFLGMDLALLLLCRLLLATEASLLFTFFVPAFGAGFVLLFLAGALAALVVEFALLLTFFAGPLALLLALGRFTGAFFAGPLLVLRALLLFFTAAPFFFFTFALADPACGVFFGGIAAILLLIQEKWELVCCRLQRLTATTCARFQFGYSLASPLSRSFMCFEREHGVTGKFSLRMTEERVGIVCDLFMRDSVRTLHSL